MESTNAAELLFFSDKAQVYKLKAADFADTKASMMGEYVPARVQMDEGESAAYMDAADQRPAPRGRVQNSVWKTLTL